MGVSFLGTQGLRWLDGGRLHSRLICRCFLPNVCSYSVSRNASVTVALTGLLVACRGLPITFSPSSFWGLAKLRKFGLSH